MEGAAVLLRKVPGSVFCARPVLAKLTGHIGKHRLPGKPKELCVAWFLCDAGKASLEVPWL